jgi:hypothetical protein
MKKKYKEAKNVLDFIAKTNKADSYAPLRVSLLRLEEGQIRKSNFSENQSPLINKRTD